jgi:hypothetical protein
MGNGKAAIGTSERLLLLLRTLSPEALRALLAELHPPTPPRGARPRRRPP